MFSINYWSRTVISAIFACPFSTIFIIDVYVDLVKILFYSTEMDAIYKASVVLIFQGITMKTGGLKFKSAILSLTIFL